MCPRLASEGAFCSSDILQQHAERLLFLYEEYLWPWDNIYTEFARKHVKVVILTHDKLKKCLASSPWWMRQRDLDLLVADEIEAYKLLDAVSTFGFFKHVLALGDPNQRVPACDIGTLPGAKLPSQDPMVEGAASSSLVRLEDDLLPWMQANAQNFWLREVHRFGHQVRELAVGMDAERLPAELGECFCFCLFLLSGGVSGLTDLVRKGSFAARYGSLCISSDAPHTKVTLIDLEGPPEMWHSVYGDGQFHLNLPAVTAMLWHLLSPLGRGETCAVILLYKPAVDGLRAVLQKIPEQWYMLRAGVPKSQVLRLLVLETPEGILGHNRDHVHFFALQPRSVADTRPKGHSCDKARRWIALTRASKSLTIWRASLPEPSHEKQTARFQALTPQVRYCIQEHEPDMTLAAWRLLTRLGVVAGVPWDAVREVCQWLASARLPAAAGRSSPVAGEWFFEPAMWHDTWGSMRWSLPVRPRPDHGVDMQEAPNLEDDAKAAHFVPFVPVQLCGRSATFASLTFALPQGLRACCRIVCVCV